MFINHLPWYTTSTREGGKGRRDDVKQNANAAQSMLSQSAFFAPPKKPHKKKQRDPLLSSEEESESEGETEEELESEAEPGGEAEGADFGDLSAVDGDISTPSNASLPAIPSGKRGAAASEKKAANMSNLAAVRAARAKEMDVPVSFASFRMSYDDRLAQQKVNVVKMLRSTVSANRELFGTQLTGMGDIFKAIDADGSGSVDHMEFRDGVKRLGLGLTAPQIQEMIAVFDEDGNGEIEMAEFLGLVNQPIINVAAVARQNWLAARAKAEAAEERMKAQAYALARKEGQLAAAAVEKQGVLCFLRARTPYRPIAGVCSLTCLTVRGS